MARDFVDGYGAAFAPAGSFTYARHTVVTAISCLAQSSTRLLAKGLR
jgi:hypothetical protein